MQIRLVTLAPEVPGALDLINRLVAAGVRVAIGHTAASAETIVEAVRRGATLSTHLGNGCASTLPRHPNLLWEQLAQDALHASFIADGHHLSASTLRAMVRAKSPARSLLVTDATAAAAARPGEYTLGTRRVRLGADGRVTLTNGTRLAGSALTLDAAIGHVVSAAGVTVDEAVAMASSQPAAYLGVRPRGTVHADWDAASAHLRIVRVVDNARGLRAYRPSVCDPTVDAQQLLAGNVVAVHDGDTVSVRISKTTRHVRLADIDCPEIGQPRGSQAKDFTSKLVFGHDVSIETRGLNQYNRVIGRVTVDGRDVSEALVRAGLAWVYSRGAADRALSEAERDARSRRMGLWADPSPVPPWTWRREHEPERRKADDTSQLAPGSEERVDVRDARGPFHGNTQSHVFHRPGCPHYNCKHCDEAFLTVESAMEAGYRPAGDCLRD